MLKSTFSYCLVLTTLSLTILVSSFVTVEIPQNFLKIRTYSSRSSKVVDLGVNRKRICNFLLVINSNFGRICYSFQDIDAFISK